MHTRMTMILAASFAAVGLAATGCRNTEHDSNRASRATGSATSESGYTSQNQRQNQSGEMQGVEHPQIRPEAGTDAEGGSTEYVVDRIDRSAQRVYFRMPNEQATGESKTGTTTEGKQPQAGHELVFTFEELRTVSPEAMTNDKLNDVVHEGQPASVVRDRQGHVTKIIFEKKSESK